MKIMFVTSKYGELKCTPLGSSLLGHINTLCQASAPRVAIGRTLHLKRNGRECLAMLSKIIDAPKFQKNKFSQL